MVEIRIGLLKCEIEKLEIGAKMFRNGSIEQNEFETICMDGATTIVSNLDKLLGTYFELDSLDELLYFSVWRGEIEADGLPDFSSCTRITSFPIIVTDVEDAADKMDYACDTVFNRLESSEFEILHNDTIVIVNPLYANCFKAYSVTEITKNHKLH